MSYYDTGSWELSEQDIEYIEWCAYSLANEERRACLKVLAKSNYGTLLRTQFIADEIGLPTTVINMNLQHLSAIGILDRSGDSSGLKWNIREKSTYDMIRKLEGISDSFEAQKERDVSSEEIEESRAVAEHLFETLLKDEK